MVGATATRRGRRVAAAVAVAESSGAPLADVLDRLDNHLRAVDRARATAAAQAAGARVSALLLAGHAGRRASGLGWRDRRRPGCRCCCAPGSGRPAWSGPSRCSSAGSPGRPGSPGSRCRHDGAGRWSSAAGVAAVARRGADRRLARGRCSGVAVGLGAYRWLARQPSRAAPGRDRAGRGRPAVRRRPARRGAAGRRRPGRGRPLRRAGPRRSARATGSPGSTGPCGSGRRPPRRGPTSAPAPAPARLAQAAVRSQHSGAAFAGSLHRVADDLRADRLIAADAAARRAGVLIVLPLGLCFLPAFVLAGLVPVIVAVLGDVLSR